MIELEPFFEVRTHFYHKLSTHDWFCDRRDVQMLLGLDLPF